MMQRIAAATVIRGNGACQAFIDGVVHDEMRRQQEQMETERSFARFLLDDRNELLGDRLAEFRRTLTGKRGPLRRIRNAIETAWAMLWAITAGKCWIEMGETLKLWVDVRKEA